MGLDDAISRRQQAHEVWEAERQARERERGQTRDALNAALIPMGVDFVSRVARIADPLPLGYWARSKGRFGGHQKDEWVGLGASGWYIYRHGFAVLTNGRFVAAHGTTPERKDILVEHLAN